MRRSGRLSRRGPCRWRGGRLPHRGPCRRCGGRLQWRRRRGRGRGRGRLAKTDVGPRAQAAQQVSQQGKDVAFHLGARAGNRLQRFGLIPREDLEASGQPFPIAHKRLHICQELLDLLQRGLLDLGNRMARLLHHPLGVALGLRHPGLSRPLSGLHRLLGLRLGGSEEFGGLLACRFHDRLRLGFGLGRLFARRLRGQQRAGLGLGHDPVGPPLAALNQIVGGLLGAEKRLGHLVFLFVVRRDLFLSVGQLLLQVFGFGDGLLQAGLEFGPLQRHPGQLGVDPLKGRGDLDQKQLDLLGINSPELPSKLPHGDVSRPQVHLSLPHSTGAHL